MDHNPISQRKERGLTTLSGAALGVSMVVGTGIFSLSGIALDIGGAKGSIFGWFFAAFVIAPFLFIFSHLGKTSSKRGLADCLGEAFGTPAQNGMTLLLMSNFLLLLPAIALVGANYLKEVMGLEKEWVSLLAYAILFLATIFNLLGNGKTVSLSKVSLVILFGILATLILCFPHFLMKGLESLFSVETSGSPVDFSAAWKVTALVIFAYLGWENLSFVSADFKHREQTISRSYALSFILVIALYLGLALLLIGAKEAGLNTSGATGITALFNQLPFGSLLALCVGLISLGNATAWMSSSSRSIVSAAEQGILPELLAQRIGRNVPYIALLFSFSVYGLIVLLCHVFEHSLSLLFLLVTQNSLVIYALAIAAYWKMSKGTVKWVFTSLGFLSCIFLLSGFHWMVISPLGIFAIGSIRSLLTGRKITITQQITKSA
ncbi:MAG: hypothetical protein A3I05_00405 [Deltaproteobacteria bacterium RIFCSPLOWO2_02_FULL_44_10]|nr:MAG: hypothetical protein A3C46_01275 [Deltaproteobacteria bacterium RIFCSPHIGHO2_02_FULL_44_16]OGQ47267.1 MAG: hypothetical protein A3I05_00405 [Deltaproteobacteria bacterium RIFCSPLOWO2_02_FULL_44_10]